MITFAIPYYKNPALLMKAVQSVAAQTRTDWKLVVCDDSSDASAEKPMQPMLADSRVRYVKNPVRLGMVENWNQCMGLCETAYVTLLHSDDELLPHYAETVITGLQSHSGASLVFCRARIIDEEGRPLFSFPDFYKSLLMPSRSGVVALRGEKGLKALLKGNFLFCPAVCFDKAKIGTEHFSSRWKMVQDLELWSRLLLDGHLLVGLPQTAYAYRRHTSNTTVEYTQNLLRFREEFLLYSTLRQALEKRSWKRAARVARRASIIKLNLGYCLAKDLGRFQWQAAREKAALLSQLFFRTEWNSR